MNVTPGTRFKLIHAAPLYAQPVGTEYEVKDVLPNGLACRTDKGDPVFIPTNCMFPVTWTEDGFQINHHSEARALAVYQFLDQQQSEGA